jgi:hypothetical protein
MYHILKSIYLLCVLFLFSALPAQTIIGSVFDNETNTPLINAAVSNRTHREFITFTDTSGGFAIAALPQHTIEVSYLGYKTVRLNGAQIVEHKNIYLTPVPVELPEIIVSPEACSLLLEKAINNLRKKLAINTKINYLWHGMEDVESTASVMESYALYDASVKRKRNKIQSDMRLLQLNHVSNQNIDSSYALKNNLLNVEFHPVYFPVTKVLEEKEKYIMEKAEDDEAIIITCFPNKEGRNTLSRASIITYTINKEDTILLSYIGQSIDSLMQKDTIQKKEGRYTILNEQFGITFTTSLKGYYLEQTYHSVIILFDANGKKEIVRSMNTTAALNGVPFSKKGQGKITGFSKQLHKQRANTFDKFWLEYLKE